MTSLPPLAQGPEAPDFPVGGRPQEWRALEEAAAFEKWFEHGAKDIGDPALAREGRGGEDATGTPAVENRATPSLVAVRRDVALEALVPAVRAGAATAAGAAAPADGAVSPRAGINPEPASARVTRAASAALDGAPGAPGPRVTRNAWSRMALTALVEDRRVRLWLRDYRLSPTELERLQRELGDELRGLGYRLAQLVVNGKERT